MSISLQYTDVLLLLPYPFVFRSYVELVYIRLSIVGILEHLILQLYNV